MSYDGVTARCTTPGCQQEATAVVTFSCGAFPLTESVCHTHEAQYLRKPGLRARSAPLHRFEVSA